MATINKSKAKGVLKELRLSKEQTEAVVAVLNLKQEDFQEKVDKKSKRAIEKLEKAKSEYKESISKAESESLVELISQTIKDLKIEIKKDEEVEKPSLSERLNPESQNRDFSNQGFNQNRY
jgi:KaiC/GvpD/RAD55 family RecA-like ATPase